MEGKKIHRHTRRAKKDLANVIAVNMGYGHQRPAHSLTHLAQDSEIVVANTYAGISKKDKRIWKQSRSFYEFISRFKRVPIVGKPAFDLFDHVQSIPEFYPRRDMSEKTLQVNSLDKLIKRGWLKDLIGKMEKEGLPIVTTFFVPALAADYYKYKHDIFCIITDTDMSRAWVAPNPKKSKIKYFAPTQRVAERLKLYGVKKQNIFMTGYPLPKSNIGGEKMTTLRKDLGARLVNLDPTRRFLDKYGDTVKKHIGARNLPKKATHPLTITFAVGGAGAQRELGSLIAYKLKKRIARNQVRVKLVAGNRNDVYRHFKATISENGLDKYFGKGVEIVYANHKDRYFDLFNEALRETDVLWTKPSELSFYAGLGIPIIMAPMIGSQEKFNKRWLRAVGAGIDQQNPEYVDEWLFDWLDSGWLAKAALEGFLYAPKMGTYNIEEILLHKKLKLEIPSLVY